MTPGLRKDFGVMYDLDFYKLLNHQMRLEATHRMGSQTGHCIWSL